MCSVVAREVSSDPDSYSNAFLGMTNVAYCEWIQVRVCGCEGVRV